MELQPRRSRMRIGNYRASLRQSSCAWEACEATSDDISDDFRARLAWKPGLLLASLAIIP
ncbi:hypothetical protein B0H19DRAFT_1116701 [Mycena capillaripes]|nr:hypothetical protein B0H19DRAFT_1116701 [Mycena capillaripes]